MPAVPGGRNEGDIRLAAEDPAMGVRTGTSLYAGLLFTLLGGIAWASGQPFIFPSLGPTAFVLRGFDRFGGTTPQDFLVTE